MAAEPQPTRQPDPRRIAIIANHMKWPRDVVFSFGTEMPTILGIGNVVSAIFVGDEKLSWFIPAEGLPSVLIPDECFHGSELEFDRLNDKRGRVVSESDMLGLVCKGMDVALAWFAARGR